MEWKIGEIRQVDNEWYQCIRDITCINCGFNNKGCLANKHITGDCSGRLDGASVVFKKLEKIGEPYLVHDHSRNKDVIVQDYKLHSQCACYNGNEEMLLFSYNGHEGTVTIKSHEPIYKKIKKDMEEKYNKLNKATGKLTLKPFDLEAAKAGKPVVTMDGRKARIICFDKKCLDEQILIVLADCGKEESIYFYTTDGKCIDDFSSFDLMMLPEKKEGWVNIYEDMVVYESKEEAELNIATAREYITTAKVKWEE